MNPKSSLATLIVIISATISLASSRASHRWQELRDYGRSPGEYRLIQDYFLAKLYDELMQDFFDQKEETSSGSGNDGMIGENKISSKEKNAPKSAQELVDKLGVCLDKNGHCEPEGENQNHRSTKATTSGKVDGGKSRKRRSHGHHERRHRRHHRGGSKVVTPLSMLANDRSTKS